MKNDLNICNDKNITLNLFLMIFLTSSYLILLLTFCKYYITLNKWHELGSPNFSVVRRCRKQLSLLSIFEFLLEIVIG